MSTAAKKPPVEGRTPERRAIDHVADKLAGVNDPETEDEWPTSGDTPADEYRAAKVPGDIGRYLLKNIPAFNQLEQNAEIRFVYRNKKDWKKDGRPRLGECTMHSGLSRFYAECIFTVTINWRTWQYLNAWQRAALVYHELRHAGVDDDGKPSTNPHDFEVFADEIELFGLRTYEDWMDLGRSIDEGKTVETQFHLPLMSVSSGIPAGPEGDGE